MELTRQQIIDNLMSTLPSVNGVPTCVSCGKPLVISKDLLHVTCPNSACECKLFRRIEIMAKAFGIDNIGIKTAERMVDDLKLESTWQFLDLKFDDLIKVGNWGPGMAGKVEENIQKGHNVTWEQFMRGIQLARVGEVTATDMAGVITNLEELFGATASTIKKAIPHCADGLAKIILESIQDKKQEIQEIYNRVTIVTDSVSTTQVASNVPDSELKDKLVAVTGATKIPRNQLKEMMKTKYGIHPTDTVSKNTFILITNETTMTSKRKKAESFGTKIMTEAEALEYFRSIVPDSQAGSDAPQQMEVYSEEI